eukprot:scaffold211800_cov41-Tisochrysis_lutea.AAC.1
MAQSYWAALNLAICSSRACSSRASAPASCRAQPRLRRRAASGAMAERWRRRAGLTGTVSQPRPSIDRL